MLDIHYDKVAEATSSPEPLFRLGATLHDIVVIDRSKQGLVDRVRKQRVIEQPDFELETPGIPAVG